MPKRKKPPRTQRIAENETYPSFLGDLCGFTWIGYFGSINCATSAPAAEKSGPGHVAESSGTR